MSAQDKVKAEAERGQAQHHENMAGLKEKVAGTGETLQAKAHGIAKHFGNEQSQAESAAKEKYHEAQGEAQSKKAGAEDRAEAGKHQLKATGHDISSKFKEAGEKVKETLGFGDK